MPVFAVTTAKDANWDRARDIRKQPFWEEHAAFADSLVDRGVIILGGPIGSDDAEDIALLAVEAADESALRSIFDADPWAVHQVFRIKDVRPWTLWLDGRTRALVGNARSSSGVCRVGLATPSSLLDLPTGPTTRDAIAFNDRMARGDGIDRIDDDGIVRFTAASRDAIVGISPALAGPLAVDAPMVLSRMVTAMSMVASPSERAIFSATPPTVLRPAVPPVAQ